MISCKSLGARGRLGNQLFQYACLRSLARRLHTRFHCPPWRGDDIFHLDDAAERTREPATLARTYVAARSNPGYDDAVLRVEDGTDIDGYFQSERFFCDRDEVRRWYTFREERVGAIADRYRGLDFSRCVGLHVRLGDWKGWPLFYIPTAAYYRRALARLERSERIVVFSDEPALARELLGSFGRGFLYVEGNEDYEDLFLMSQCRDVVSSASTFSWWGAWLGERADRRVVVPREGPLRPGAPVQNPDYWCDGWIRVRALRPVLDGYAVARFRRRVAAKTVRALRASRLS